MKLGAMLADSATRFPDREAVVCGGRRIAFGELDRTASRLAGAFAALGQKPGDRLAMYLPNSAELAEAMLGAAKSGGVIVPIATRLAPAEARYILRDCDPWAILFAPDYRDAVRDAASELANPLLIAIGQAEAGETAYEALLADDNAPPPLPGEPDDLLIGYTSGTTGRPKGAVATNLGAQLGADPPGNGHHAGPGYGRTRPSAGHRHR